MAVYFIQAGSTDAVKIGSARDPEARILDLQRSNHEKLRIIRIVDGDMRAERWFHDRFSAQRSHGEWFTFVPEMLTVELGNSALMDRHGPVGQRSPTNTPSARIIQRFGGAAKFARSLGKSESVIHSWKKIGRIPSKHHEEILQAAKQAAIGLTHSDFFEAAE